MYLYQYAGNHYELRVYPFGLVAVCRLADETEVAVLQGDEGYELRDTVDNAETPEQIDLLLDCYDYQDNANSDDWEQRQATAERETWALANR